MDEKQGVTCTAQDLDTMLCPKTSVTILLYGKLFYCTTHENNNVTVGEHQCHSNVLSDQ